MTIYMCVGLYMIYKNIFYDCDFATYKIEDTSKLPLKSCLSGIDVICHISVLCCFVCVVVIVKKANVINTIGGEYTIV